MAPQRESGWAAGPDTSFPEVSEPLDLSDGIPAGGSPVPSIEAVLRLTSILPAMMEQAAAHPYSPSRAGATEVGWGLRALFCQQTHL